MIPFDVLHHSIGGKSGKFDVPCPLCGPSRNALANRTRHVLRVWHVSPSFISFSCARCGEKGYAHERGAPRIDPVTRARVQTEITEHARVATANRLKKALALWRSRQPLRGTIAETYLREARAYRHPQLPRTLGFLPARGEYPPAMIAAFGIPDEPEPHVLLLPDSRVKGVHLTRLAPDGSDRDRSEKAKIMVGHSKGWPIILSPPTDGLSLAVAEGIESALSASEATGLYTWVAGSAGRLPALANVVPAWTESITIFAEGDIDGRRHAASFAQEIRQRGIEARLCLFSEDSAA